VTRAREEGGFGMLELLLAMVVLNIGIFALVGAFNAGTVAVSRARYISSATAVADKQMEVYRSLQNCAIWLDRWLMPASNSAYAQDAYDFNGTSAFSPQIPYWNSGGSADTQYWVTDGMDINNAFAQDNLTSCAYISQTTTQTMPLTSTQGSSANIDGLGMVTPPSSAVKPVQVIAGPDGTSYTVDTYIVLVQPTAGEWTKQVTVAVYDPHNSSRVLAREVSTFDPTVAP
jgi:type II secretory pathway pseudopilin PulG